eukprot:807209-Pyramimonas_sp.AAC.3
MLRDVVPYSNHNEQGALPLQHHYRASRYEQGALTCLASSVVSLFLKWLGKGLGGVQKGVRRVHEG